MSHVPSKDLSCHEDNDQENTHIAIFHFLHQIFRATLLCLDFLTSTANKWQRRLGTPDYFSYAVLLNLGCHLFAVEVKKSKQRSVAQDDTENLAQEMKDYIDPLARQQVDVRQIKVYDMCVTRGIYAMKTYAQVLFPSSHHELYGLAGPINVFLNLQKDIIESIGHRASVLEYAPDMTRPSFGTQLGAKCMDWVMAIGLLFRVYKHVLNIKAQYEYSLGHCPRDMKDLSNIGFDLIDIKLSLSDGLSDD
ncbi:hypothetical protein BGZ58_004273 [Dissophora ornata]|nr:hypothetical protein BGZ58_004273 [Dissophora ornata]